MIKKLIGIIAAVAVIVIVVVAAIRRDNFRSMVQRDKALNAIPGPVGSEEQTDALQYDSADPAVGPAVSASGAAGPDAVTQVDSLTVTVVDSL